MTITLYVPYYDDYIDSRMIERISFNSTHFFSGHAVSPYGEESLILLKKLKLL